MDKIWCKSYPKDLNYFIEIDPNEDIIDIYKCSVKKYGHRIADECMGKTITYNKLFQLSSQFASFCQNNLNLKKGDRLGIMSINVLQYHIAMFGALQAGLVVVGINPMYTPHELKYQFKDSGIKALVALDIFGRAIEETIKEIPIQHIIITSLGDMFNFPKRFLVNLVVKKIKKLVKKYNIPNAISFTNTLKIGHQSKLTDVQLHGSDLAFLQYTGGTTGVSKGVMLSHNNITANIRQIGARIMPLLNKNDIWIAPLPMFHIFALTSSLIPLFIFGSRNVFIPNPRDLNYFIKIAKTTKFAVITGVNSLFNALVHHKEFQKADFSALKMSLAGGMPVQKQVANKWQEITGCVLHVAYGLSETSPGATGDFYNQAEFSDSIGYPFPMTDVKICDPDTGEEKDIGESGEIWLKGPQVMQGYWQKPEETAKVLIDGWLKTGDVGIIDNAGKIKLIDRVKDIIIVSGFNVYSVEVEHVISEIPEVLDVAVIGLPHAKTGEMVKAHIILKADVKLTKKQVSSYCKRMLTSYKCPKVISFTQTLPLSSVGKILKRELRKLPENQKYFQERTS